MNRKEFAIKILKENCPFDDETQHKYLNPYGRQRDKSLIRELEQSVCAFGDEDDEEGVNQELIEDILYGMNEYIRGYAAIPPFKQKIWNDFSDWIINVSNKYDISNIDELITEMLEKPIDEETPIAIVKALHEGTTKDDIRKALRVEERTVRNAINSLCPSLNSNNSSKKRKKQPKPVRFGGQVMHVDIAYREGKNKVREYYTSETLNPVALQLNVYQVGSLLKGLQLAYDSDISRNSINIAINVWSQLTSYCKNRIKEKYHPGDKEFQDFISLVDKNEKGEPFLTEKEMFEKEPVLSKLEMAFKGARRCDLKINGQIIRNCRIDLNFDNYKYYVCCGNERYEVQESEIEDIILVD